ncbi:MAG: hypothetical protein IKS41_01020 [Alphaproteobacteria bacterium]|nr:hypothetical protein [Alphaproteobacteria bacterium]
MMKLNQAMRTMAAVAIVAMGAGCETMREQEKSNPLDKYEGFLDPHDQDFQHQKEATQNAGKIVEAVWVPAGTNGQQVVLYGVRSKTWDETTNDHLRRNAPLYDMGRWTVDKAIDGTRLGVEFKGYQEMRRLNTTERRQNHILQGIGNSILGL